MLTVDLNERISHATFFHLQGRKKWKLVKNQVKSKIK